MEKVENIRRKVVFALYSSIVEKTPVDTGRARGNWMISVGQPKGTSDPASRTPVHSGGANVPAASGPGESYYIENNLPYINTLEYGGYPSPVKKGTRLRDGTYEVRSEGGFSKQAPQGMVGLSVLEFQQFVGSAASEEGFSQ